MAATIQSYRSMPLCSLYFNQLTIDFAVDHSNVWEVRRYMASKKSDRATPADLMEVQWQIQSQPKVGNFE